jgi:hypothetical protein
LGGGGGGAPLEADNMVETEEKYKSKRMFEESVLSKEVLREEAFRKGILRGGTGGMANFPKTDLSFRNKVVIILG